MVVLLEAIKQKYCPDEVGDDRNILPVHKPVKETATIYRPGAVPLQKLTSVVLDKARITRVVHCKELSGLCPNVLELHLAANLISKWNSVVSLLSAFPKLRFLDLSQNLLDLSPADQDGDCDVTPHSNLTTLVLNCTMVTWAMLKDLLPLLPSLEELHLSLNSNQIIPPLVAEQFPSVKQLYINDCGLSCWDDFCRLSDVFPCLEQLIAGSNPLQYITPTASPQSSSKCVDSQAADGKCRDDSCSGDSNDLVAATDHQLKSTSLATANEDTAASKKVCGTTIPFSCLRYLNINNCRLSSWEDIDSLGQLPLLTEASLLGIPVGDTLAEKERRMAYICRLQQLKKLNKSSISEDERESAERWFVRLHLDDPNPPQIYTVLVKRHGNLLPLAEVNMAAKETARLYLTFQNISDRPAEEHEIDLQCTTWELRSWIGKELLGVPTDTLALYYIDKAIVSSYGAEMMKYNYKRLYTYRMNDGDEIDVKIKSQNARTYHSRR